MNASENLAGGGIMVVARRLKWWTETDPVTVRALSIMRAYLWCFAIATLVLAAAMWGRIPVPINYQSFYASGLLALVLSGLALAFTRLKPMPATAAAIDGAAFILFFLPLNMVMIYGVVWLTRELPLRDPWLAAVDRLIGFDWLKILAWQNAHPTLSEILRHAYESIIKQIGLVLLLLPLVGQPQRLLMFLSAAMVALMLCVVGIGLMPAIGAYHFYGIDPAHHHPAIALSTNSLHVAHFQGMRAGTMEILSLGRTKGIVTFPSFHTTAAILFAWSLWRIPVIRWVGVAVNILMIAGTPMHGGHYLIDVIAGTALAALSIAAAHQLWQFALRRARIAVDRKNNAYQQPQTAGITLSEADKAGAAQ